MVGSFILFIFVMNINYNIMKKDNLVGIEEIVTESPTYLNDEFEQEIIDFIEENEVDSIQITKDGITITDCEGYEELFIFNDYLDLAEYSRYNALEYIETTSNSNGYPSNIKPAITGFNTFEDAENVARELGLNVEIFTTRDGWSLWVRNNNRTYEPFTISSEDYGDNYGVISKINEENFIDEYVKPYIDDLMRFDDIDNLLDNKKLLWNEIDAMDADEVVVTLYGEHYETLKETSMRWSHDTKHFIIGVI